MIVYSDIGHAETAHMGLFTFFVVLYIAYIPFQLMECHQNAYTTFTGDIESDDYVIFNAIDVPVHSSVLNEMRIKTIKRLNTKSHHCITKQHYDQCRNDCFQKKLKEAQLCKLPFIPNELMPCDSVDAAKMARKSYLQIVLDEMHKCRCVGPCEEIIYFFNSYSQSQAVGTPFFFAFVMPSNIIENIVQVENYPLIALLCDIGNSLGLALATSVLILARYLRRLFIWLLPP
uniref:Uncharacterized protein n=1 Tax=Strigamia maritima TaxID=126957 RepID=T1IUT5_STRMM